MKLKKHLLVLIKYIPFSNIKNQLYRILFGYSIGKNVKVGKSMINCKKVTIGDGVYIANHNVFSCEEIAIGDNTKIQSGNIFLGKSSFSIGKNSRIINNHYFDLWNNVSIGDNTWIAGRGSQFWTHGSLYTRMGTKDLSISIGNDTYIGSNCLFVPGAKINSKILVGLGSVVTKIFEGKNIIIAGNPASIIKKDIYWRTNW
jgi:acetyltransferase-like isoleucine patch superfamily enzyme